MYKMAGNTKGTQKGDIDTLLEMKKKIIGHLSGVTVFNGDLGQCFVAGLIALVGIIALAHAAADARLALLHQWFRATALSNHLHEGLHFSVE